MNNPLELLWNSTQNLYDRFDLDAPMSDRVRKFEEEVEEFLTEVRAFEYGVGWETALTEEANDVLVTITGILQKRGIKLEYWFMSMNEVSDKNNAKTLETHVVHDGLITSRKKLLNSGINPDEL